VIISHLYNLELVLDLSRIRSARDPGLGILAFRFPNLEYKLQNKPIFARHENPFFYKLDRRIQKFTEQAMSKVSNTFHEKQLFDSQYPSKILDFNFSQGVYLQGFFQSAKIVEVASEIQKELKPSLASRSPWMKNIANQVSGRTLMHVRRGDYRLSQQWGLLPTKYYENALLSLGITSSEEVVVFTDDHIEVKREFKSSKILSQARVLDTNACKAAEVLSAMVLAGQFISSNSTLSWWAGVLTYANVVVGPTNFYRENNVNKERYGQKWSLIQSEWLN
jgi:hypothetical protein